MMTKAIANNNQLAFDNPKIPVKQTTNKIALTMVPIKSQGLNLPYFVRVLSTILPKMGSKTTSANRIITTNVVIKPINLLAIDFSTPANIPEVTYTIKYVLYAP